MITGIYYLDNSRRKQVAVVSTAYEAERSPAFDVSTIDVGGYIKSGTIRKPIFRHVSKIIARKHGLMDKVIVGPKQADHLQHL